MKPGDLVQLSRSLQFTVSSDEREMLGLIIYELRGYALPHVQVLWSTGTLLVEDAGDLEVCNEAG